MVRGVTISTHHSYHVEVTAGGMLAGMTDTIDTWTITTHQVFGAEFSGAHTATALDPAGCRRCSRTIGCSCCGSHLTHGEQVELAQRWAAYSCASGDPGHPDVSEIPGRMAKGGRNALAHRRHFRRYSAGQPRCWSTMPLRLPVATLCSPTLNCIRAAFRAVAEVVRQLRGRASNLALRVLGRAVRLGAHSYADAQQLPTMLRRFHL